MLMPLHLALCVLWRIGCTFPEWLLPGDRHGWTFWQRLSYPFVKRMIWAITDIGSPPHYTPEQERTYNAPLVFVQHLAFWSDATLFSSRLRIEDCVLEDYDRMSWIQKEAIDPHGIVRPTRVPLFWFESKSHPELPDVKEGPRRARPGERVLLYFMGGGYVIGSPTQGNRCFVLAKRTGLTIVGVNYRKATTARQAFPAALQDAVTAYRHMLTLGFRDIVLAGDSAGAALCLTLTMYLCNTLAQGEHAPQHLKLPTALLLYSPWCDLTLSSCRDGVEEEYKDDLLNASMLLNASAAYLQHTAHEHAAKDPLDRSPMALGADHAFVSPSLPSSYSTLLQMTKSYSRAEPIDILMFVGGAEIFAPEVRRLAKHFDNLARETGAVKFEFHDVAGEVHCFPLVPKWLPNEYPRPHLRTPSPTGYTTLAAPHPPATSSNDTRGRQPRRQSSGGQHGAKPTPLQSIKALMLGGWINVLLIAVPLSFLSHFLGWGSTADFVISFIAIIPLASLLGDATEQCSLKLGQTLGGLMNATFGNAVEAIVGILALVKGELRIVQTSMLGSILSNILLVLGCSFLAAGWKFKESNFQVTAAQASSSLMVLGTATLIIPAAYHSSRLEAEQMPHGGLQLIDALGKKKDFEGLLTLSRGTAVVLLISYIAYLFFQLRSHAYLFEAENDDEEEEARMDTTTAIASLLVVTVITSFCADYLVGAIDEFANDFHIPKAFIGLILIPIVGNAAEHVTSVWMAAKGKMEITIGVSVGSSIQIAVGVIPLLVVVGWIIGQDLTLFFENFETICLFVSIFLVNVLIADGISHWLEGWMLVALYIVIALAFWVS
ncbi:hypothetical protein OIO90_000107 [Microbotryomycetes sp. JL221]|nr:hypothetical protein OIO90_000107 [Microbotryomycetes sp. JL221]